MFRRKSKKSLSTDVKKCIVRERSAVTELVDGEEVSRVVTVERDVLDPSTAPEIPTRSEYSLKNLLASGVPLGEIPVGQLLNPTDLAELQAKATAGLINLAPQFSSAEVPEQPVEVVETPAPSAE